MYFMGIIHLKETLTIWIMSSYASNNNVLKNISKQSYLLIQVFQESPININPETNYELITMSLSYFKAIHHYNVLTRKYTLFKIH